MNPHTGVKFDTNQESNKEPTNTHSHASARATAHRKESAALNCNNEVSNYLQSLSVPRKRDREQAALGELLTAGYSRAQVKIAIDWLQSNGLPSSGEPCHSPIVFLATGAITQVLEKAETAERKKNAALNSNQVTAAKAQQELAEQEADNKKAAEREAKFLQCYPSPEAQVKFVAEFRARHPEVAVLTGVGLRRLAIIEWAGDEESIGWVNSHFDLFVSSHDGRLRLLKKTIISP